MSPKATEPTSPQQLPSLSAWYTCFGHLDAEVARKAFLASVEHDDRSVDRMPALDRLAAEGRATFHVGPPNAKSFLRSSSRGTERCYGANPRAMLR
jgi:hypothetical protein